MTSNAKEMSCHKEQMGAADGQRLEDMPKQCAQPGDKL